MNQRIFKVKDEIAELEVQSILLSQKISFEEERDMRKAIAQFSEKLAQENQDISKLNHQVRLL